MYNSCIIAILFQVLVKWNGWAAWFSTWKCFNVNATTFHLPVYTFDVNPFGFLAWKKIQWHLFKRVLHYMNRFFAEYVELVSLRISISKSISVHCVCRKACFLFPVVFLGYFFAFSITNFLPWNYIPCSFKSFLTACSGIVMYAKPIHFSVFPSNDIWISQF